MPRKKVNRRKFTPMDTAIEAIQMIGKGYKIYKDFTASANSTNKSRGTTGGVKMESGGKVGKFIKARTMVMHPKSLQYVKESPGTVQDYNCAYVGHSTLPAEFALEMAAWGLARLLFTRLGVNPTSVVDDEITLDGTISIFWRPFPTSAGSNTTVAGYVSTSLSMAYVGDNIFSTMNTIILANPSVVFDVLQFVPDVDGTVSSVRSLTQKIVISQCLFQYGVVSDLKVQNATKHEVLAGIDSEITNVVDACPLIGKIYSGKGQGVWEKANTTLSNHAHAVMCDRLEGVMMFSPGTSTALDGWEEPINANILENVKKCSGIMFSPGEIHTSRLVDGFKGNLQKWLIMISPHIATTERITRGLGKFAMVGAEKMIGLQTNVPSDYTPVRLIYELNQTWNVYVSEKKHNDILQTYSKRNNVDSGP